MQIFGPKQSIPVRTALWLQCWALQLSAFTYDIKYRTSKANANADALSYLPLKETDLKGDFFSLQEVGKLHYMMVSHLPVSSANIHAAMQDVLLSRVALFIIQGWPRETEITPEIMPFYGMRDSLPVEEGCLLHGNHMIIPKKYQSTLLAELHQDHPGIVRMKALVSTHVWWPTWTKTLKE